MQDRKIFESLTEKYTVHATAYPKPEVTWLVYPDVPYLSVMHEIYLIFIELLRQRISSYCAALSSFSKQQILKYCAKNTATLPFKIKLKIFFLIFFLILYINV